MFQNQGYNNEYESLNLAIWACTSRSMDLKSSPLLLLCFYTESGWVLYFLNHLPAGFFSQSLGWSHHEDSWTNRNHLPAGFFSQSLGWSHHEDGWANLVFDGGYCSINSLEIWIVKKGPKW